MGAVVGVLIALYVYRRAVRREREHQGLVIGSRVYIWVWVGAMVALIWNEEQNIPLQPLHLVAVAVLCPDLVFRLLCRPLAWTWGSYGISSLANFTWNQAPLTGATCDPLTRLPPGARCDGGTLSVP